MQAISQYLTASARAYPEHPAARFKGESLSYQELEEQSNQLAAALLASGIKRGDRVGIYLNKSFGSLVSVFGIMKTGAAYVPFDPSAPLDRLAFIARDSQIAALVTSASKSSSLLALNALGAGLKHICILDGAAPQLEGLSIQAQADLSSFPTTAPDQSPVPEDVAYILYTSGSTGRPKGVVIQHRNLSHFMQWAEEDLGLQHHDIVTSHAPLHFDLSTFDIYATIKVGGTIVLLPEMLSLFPVQLAQVLQDEKVTTIYMVPSILTMLLHSGKLSSFDLSALNKILFAGEVFPIKFLKELAALIPHAGLFNLYGPTETNVCTWYKVNEQDLSASNTAPVSIGIACGPTTLLLIDEQGREVKEPGVEGELTVRGSCVALGYFANPEKSALLFSQSVDGELQYKTGDVVTYKADGINLVYKGRRDHMVKSRGYRIELTEVETVLLAHPQIKEGVVVAVPDELIGCRLHAFVSLGAQAQVSAAELRDHCQQKLPSYMVPESFKMCPDLPLTSTGKIDRIALVQQI